MAEKGTYKAYIYNIYIYIYNIYICIYILYMPSYTNLISSINVQCWLHTTDLNHLPYLHILQTI